VVAYQARMRQKVTRRRMGIRIKSGKPYLTLAKEMSFCRLNFSSFGHRRRKGAVSGQRANLGIRWGKWKGWPQSKVHRFPPPT
jgi:hypothetical protein